MVQDSKVEGRVEHTPDAKWQKTPLPCGCYYAYRAVAFCPMHAAAPALLEALEEMLGQYVNPDDTGWRKRLHDDARAAIAAARGEGAAS